MLEKEQGGRFFRAAWIQGVTTHFPGTPKSGYIAPWEEMSEWEQLAAIIVYEKAYALILVGLQAEPSVQLVAEQGGRFISEAWNVQVYRRIPQPKSGYVADWEDLPLWQCATDAYIFEEIQKIALQEQRQL